MVGLKVKIYTKAEMYQVLPSWSGNFGLGCMGVLWGLRGVVWVNIDVFYMGVVDVKDRVCVATPLRLFPDRSKTLQKVTKGIYHVNQKP